MRNLGEMPAHNDPADPRTEIAKRVWDRAKACVLARYSPDAPISDERLRREAIEYFYRELELYFRPPTPDRCPCCGAYRWPKMMA